MKIQDKTIEEIRQEVANQEVIVITNRTLLWHKTVHNPGDYLASEEHILKIVKDKDYKETEAYIEGYFRRA